MQVQSQQQPATPPVQAGHKFPRQGGGDRNSFRNVRRFGAR